MHQRFTPRQISPLTPPADMRPATRALDGGLQPDPVTGAIAPNISMSVNNVFAPGGAGFSAEGADLTSQPYLYARWTNPTVRDLEKRLASLEGGQDALATATGVAAIAAVFLALLKSGDHLILSDVCYAGAYELATRILPGFGIAVTPVNLSDLAAVRRRDPAQYKADPCRKPVQPLAAADRSGGSGGDCAGAGGADLGGQHAGHAGDDPAPVTGH